jgi:hypothetical protein
MIKNILELLPYAKGETETIQIAKGKYYLPETLRDTFNVFKKEVRWQKR